jgi:glycosyltransferase involved in cell wall biosynthesis
VRRWLALAGTAAARAAAFAVVAVSYALVLAVCRLLPRPRRETWHRTVRIVVCGTFHNPNWFRSHATPLARSGLEEVIVVTDRPQPAVDRVRVVRPPRWIAVIVGRAVARLAWTIVVGVRAKPDLYMGYHIIPNSLIALVAARLLSRPACYQMTSGPAEVDGGGYRSDNPFLGRLRQPSGFLERLAMSVVRQFDLVVVRGAGARRFLAERGVNRVAIITGSVDRDRLRPSAERPYHLLSVGQLIERKRPLEFLEIAAAVARDVPGLRAAMVGDGPLMSQLRVRAGELGVAEQVELCGQMGEVEELLGRSRVFVLSSRNEGLSIAMAEAMMSGAVPVVTDVGDLRDLVRHGVNGYLVAAGDCQEFVCVITNLLRDEELWSRLSQAAIESARTHTGLDHVAELWATHLRTSQRPDASGSARAGLGAANP